MAADMKAQIDKHNTYINSRKGQVNHNILTQFKQGLLVQINMQEPFSVADATMLNISFVCYASHAMSSSLINTGIGIVED